LRTSRNRMTGFGGTNKSAVNGGVRCGTCRVDPLLQLPRFGRAAGMFLPFPIRLGRAGVGRLCPLPTGRRLALLNNLNGRFLARFVSLAIPVIQDPIVEE
jgi:hypothetical protein